MSVCAHIGQGRWEAPVLLSNLPRRRLYLEYEYPGGIRDLFYRVVPLFEFSPANSLVEYSRGFSDYFLVQPLLILFSEI